MHTIARTLAPLLLTLGLLAGMTGTADAAPRPGVCHAAGYYNQATTVANPQLDVEVLFDETPPRFNQARCVVDGIRIVITYADASDEVAALRHTTLRTDRDARAERLYCLTDGKAYSVELAWMSRRIEWRSGEVARWNAWADRFAARRGCAQATR